MDEADAFDVKLRRFFSDVAITFKRTKQRAEETFGNVERTKFDAEIETQWWMLLTAQKEIKVTRKEPFSQCEEQRTRFSTFR